MKRILLLEDDLRLCETLAALLSSKFKVQIAHSLGDATKLIANQRFDVIVSDFVLNDGDGFSVLKMIDAILPRPKIIFITAYAEKDMAVKLLNEDVDGLLEKPFEFSKLLHYLETEVLKENSHDACKIKLVPYEKKFISGNLNVELTDVEFKIIGYLVAQKGAWISRGELIEHIWGNAIQSRNALDTHLSNLKRKIPTFKEDLKVVRGRGYLYSPQA